MFLTRFRYCKPSDINEKREEERIESYEKETCINHAGHNNVVIPDRLRFRKFRRSGRHRRSCGARNRGRRL